MRRDVGEQNSEAEWTAGVTTKPRATMRITYDSFARCRAAGKCGDGLLERQLVK